MEETTDCTMQEIQEGLPSEGDSLKRKREEIDKETTTDKLQYPVESVEGEPVVVKARLENSEPVENEVKDSSEEAGHNDDPIMDGEGVGENPEKIGSKVDDRDQEHVIADGKEKEEQVNAQGGEASVKIDKETDSKTSEDSGKESEENGQVDAPGKDEGDKHKQSSIETGLEKPVEVEGLEEKKDPEICAEPMEVECFTEKKESGRSGEHMDVEDPKEREEDQGKVENEKRMKDNVGERTEADEFRQAEDSQEEVSKNIVEIEKNAKDDDEESCKAKVDEFIQADVSREVLESKVEIEKNRKEDRTQADQSPDGEDLPKEEFTENKVELEKSRDEETGKSFEVEAEKLRQAEGSEAPVEKVETMDSTQENTGDLSKAEGDELTQAEDSQEEEIPDSKVVAETSKEENTGEASKTETDEHTQKEGSDEKVSGNKVEVEDSIRENVKDPSKTGVSKLPEAECSKEEVQEDTVDINKGTKLDTGELGMTEAAEPTEVEGSEEKGPGEHKAGDETIMKEDTGESSVEEGLKPMGGQGSEEKGPGEDKAGNETSAVATGELLLTEVDKLTESEGSLEKTVERREEPHAAKDSEKEKNVKSVSKIGTSTKEDIDQSSEKFDEEGCVKVEDLQNESNSTEELMEVEHSSEKEDADEGLINIQKSKEEVIASPMDLEHIREQEEDADGMATVHNGTEDLIVGPMELEHAREKEEDAEGVANAQKYTEDVIAGPMELGYSREREEKEVNNVEKGTGDATAGPMEVDQSMEKEVTKETDDVEKETEDVPAAPLEAHHTKEVEDPKDMGQDPKEEEAVLSKSTQDVNVGPEEGVELITQSATEAEREHAAKPEEEEGEEEGALDSQQEETEEKEAINESSDEKSETGTERDAMSSPTPTRKRGRKRVAAKAAERQKDSQKPPRNPERVELLKKMATLKDMKKLLAEHGRSEKDYKVGDIIEVDDLMQSDYDYELEAPVGKDFAEGFSPRFTPKEMLELGIFEGKVINDCIFEFPKEWYEGAAEKGKLCPQGPDDSVNHFKVNCRLPSKEWRKKGWLPKKDPHGWFQWYCRYYLGRRLEPDDSHQMSRWRQMRRHSGQIKRYCEPGDLSCRAKQRQTLLNWAHDCFM